jgi:hypothetical protein
MATPCHTPMSAPYSPLITLLCSNDVSLLRCVTVDFMTFLLA